MPGGKAQDESAGKISLKCFLLMGCAALAAFWLLTLSPIDPLQQNVGQAALGSMSPEQIAKLEAYWGADTPPLERFLPGQGNAAGGTLVPRFYTAGRCWR